MMSPPVFPVISWLSHRRLVSDLYKRLMVEGADVDTAQAEMNFRNQQRASHPAQKQWPRSGLHRHDAGLLAGHRGEPGHRRRRRPPAAPRRAAAAGGGDAAGPLRLHRRRRPRLERGFVRHQLDVLGAFLDAGARRGSPRPPEPAARPRRCMPGPPGEARRAPVDWARCVAAGPERSLEGLPGGARGPTRSRPAGGPDRGPPAACRRGALGRHGDHPRHPAFLRRAPRRAGRGGPGGGPPGRRAAGTLHVAAGPLRQLPRWPEGAGAVGRAP